MHTGSLYHTFTAVFKLLPSHNPAGVKPLGIHVLLSGFCMPCETMFLPNFCLCVCCGLLSSAAATAVEAAVDLTAAAHDAGYLSGTSAS